MSPSADEGGRIVLIAGATGGVGRAVTDSFVKNGDVVVLVSRSHDRLAHLAASLAIPEDSCLLLAADLTDSVQARSMVAEAVSRFGRIDVVVNLTGSFVPGRLAATTDELWHGQLAENLHAHFHVLREAVPHMPDGSAIVNAANSLPVEGRGGQLAYAVAKGGVITLTQSLAKELAPRRIRVNAILPYNVDTPGNRTLQPQADPSPWPKPEELAEVVLFLASDRASTVTGALIPV